MPRPVETCPGAPFGDVKEGRCGLRLETLPRVDEYDVVEGVAGCCLPADADAPPTEGVDSEAFFDPTPPALLVLGVAMGVGLDLDEAALLDNAGAVVESVRLAMLSEDEEAGVAGMGRRLAGVPDDDDDDDACSTDLRGPPAAPGVPDAVEVMEGREAACRLVEGGLGWGMGDEARVEEDRPKASLSISSKGPGEPGRDVEDVLLFEEEEEEEEEEAGGSGSCCW